MKEKRRVVITGLGMITPLGTGVEKNWEAVCNGQSGVGPLTRFDAGHLRCQVAGEIKDFVPLDYLDSKFIRRFDPFFQYTVASARMAFEDSGLKKDSTDMSRMGVIIGTSVGAHTYFKSVYDPAGPGHTKVPPFFIMNAAGNMVAAVTAIEFGCRGPHHCVMDACASGSSAVGLGYRTIQHNEADVMLVGASESPLVEPLIASLDALGALSTGRNKEPHKASRPFDRQRDGFVSGEGSGVLVIESLEHALERGASIYGEIAGFGNNCDAYHYSAPKGETQADCIRLAMQDAGISPAEVDYINAHGTSTILSDAGETTAIKAALGEYAASVPVSSTKSATGHLWGAAGAVEAIFTLLTIRHGIIPPTINYDMPDPACDLDYVPNKARKADVKTAMSNSFGFGGINGALVFKRFEARPSSAS
ncbi:MAG: beta-ketoacyl-ACP synthase II [Dehalococcoidia bacterium]|nr:beta-ketoacyl-ACP synthase II [Dehalococcoidia bacterium]